MSYVSDLLCSESTKPASYCLRTALSAVTMLSVVLSLLKRILFSPSIVLSDCLFPFDHDEGLLSSTPFLLYSSKSLPVSSQFPFFFE